MKETLIPCDRCRRHVFDRETRCPFCQSTLTGPGRAVIAAAAISAGLALSACDRPVAAVYGGPPPPSSNEGRPQVTADEVSPPPTSTAGATTAPTAPAPTTSGSAGAPAPKPTSTTKALPVDKRRTVPVPAYGRPPSSIDGR